MHEAGWRYLGASYSLAPWVEWFSAWTAMQLGSHFGGSSIDGTLGRLSANRVEGGPNAIASEIQPLVAVEFVKEAYMVSWVVVVIKSIKEKRR